MDQKKFTEKKPHQFHIRGLTRVVAKKLHPFFRKPGSWLFYNNSRKPWCGNMKAVCDAASMDERLNQITIINFGITETKEIRAQYQNSRVSVSVINGGKKTLLRAALSADVTFVTEYTRYGFPGFTVNLWHGIPLKRIGIFENNQWKPRRWLGMKSAGPVPQVDRFNHHDLLISASAHDRVVMSACFNMHPEKVINSGLPRNDWLNPDNKLPLEYEDLLQKIIHKCEGRPLCLYAPTFRDEDRSALIMTKKQLSQLADVVYKNGMMLGYRPHITVQGSPVEGIKNCLDFGSDKVPDIQVLLRHASILITDYSSCALDYMLLKRPIISYAPDIDKYSRGFLYDFRSVFPGKIFEDFEDFIKEISMVSEGIMGGFKYRDSDYAEMIQRQAHLFHDHRENSWSSTQYLISRIIEIRSS